ncbi:MAG: transcription termination factor NusA [Planctomycetota bacterium]|nr:MAG: transcription termination factor NusA [Planctomycetota bacterium]
MNGELLRIVEALHKDKEIPKEIIFEGIKAALRTAVKKRFSKAKDVDVRIDKETGEVTALIDGGQLRPDELGRIAAHIAKQLIMQKIREAEAEVLYREFKERIGELVRGTIQRIERGTVVVDIDGVEAVLPPREKMPNDDYRPGQRMKFIIKSVTKQGQKVRVELSRLGEEFIKHLFEEVVPELREGIVEIVGVARDPGHRTKIAVATKDPRVDPVGALVGVKGARIRGIVEELGGERIDVVSYSENAEEYVIRALKIDGDISISVDEEHRVAYVTVPTDRLSVAIGRHGQNVRLASRLTGWQIEIAPETVEIDIEGVPEEAIENLYDAGYQTLEDIKEASVEELCKVEGVTPEIVAKIKDYIRQVEERLIYGEEGEQQ